MFPGLVCSSAHRTQGIRHAVSAQTPVTRALVNIVPAAHIARGTFVPR